MIVKVIFKNLTRFYSYNYYKQKVLPHIDTNLVKIIFLDADHNDLVYGSEVICLPGEVILDD